MKRLVLPLALVMAACGDDPVPPPPPAPDTTAPVISGLAVSPETVGRAETVTATFTLDEELKTLLVRVGGRVAECAVESLAATCTHTISGAEKEGPQTVEVLAIDLAGNESTASGAFTIDYAAPSLAFTAQPPALTNVPDAQVDFTSDDPAATFTCTVDGGAEAACTSPFVAPGLAEGHHVIRVTAKDAHGNTRSAQASFTVDVTAPTTTLVTGIPAITREQSHRVTFTTNDPRATFECRIDAAAFAPCMSPFQVTGYAEGARSFELRARDEAGNTDATPVKVDFNADWTAPQTTVGQVADTGARDVEIPFTSNEPAALVECSIYGGPFAPCTSPLALAGLPDGTHSVLIRSSDAAGNVEDPPVFIQYVVDRTPPQTTIFAAPVSPTNQTSPSFEFSSTEANSTFECGVDGAALAACTSPATYTLAHGDHTFVVVATDKYGNKDLTPASHAFAVDTVLPNVAFNPPLPATHLQPTLSVEFAADEPASLYECSLDGAAYAACTSPTVLTGLTATVGTGTPHVFKVRATDVAGNLGPELTGTFDIDLSTPPPGIPALVPFSPSLTSNTTPTLAWEAASNSTGYDVELSDAPDVAVTGEFLTSKQRFEDVTSLAQVTQALSNGVYYFHVRAKNATGAGGWSRTARFEVNTWAQVSPHPTTDTLKDIVCRTAEQCVIVGDSGTVLRTMDSGRTLDRSSTPAGTTALNSIAWAGGDVLVATGGTSSVGMVIRSEDFGASWTQITTTSEGAAFPSLSSGRIHFNGQTGVFTGASGTVMISHDAGASWTPVPTKPGISTIYAGAVVETTPALTLLAAESTKLHRSTDGGTTWTTATIASTGLPDIALAPDGTVFVGGSANLYRSSDKGATLEQITAATADAFNKVSGINTILPLDANTVVTANSVTSGVTQTRLGTIDAGGKISFVNATRTDPDATLMPSTGSYSVWVDANLNGLMVGVGGMLYNVSGSPTALSLMTPRGTSGAPLNSTGSGNIIGLAFPSATVGYATAATHTNFLKSVNSGNTWKLRDIDPVLTDETFSALHFFDENHGIGVGKATHVPTAVGSQVAAAPWAARTTDGGLTWTQLELPASAVVASRSLNGVAFSGPDAGFAVGAAITTGTSGSEVFALGWNATTSKFDAMPVLDTVGMPLRGKNLNDVAVHSPTNALLVGVGTIAKLDASTGIWKSENNANDATMNAVAFVDADVAVAVGNSGNIWRRTVEAGIPTWTKLSVTGLTTTTLYDVAFHGQHGYIVGASKTLIVSSDGGATWTRFTNLPESSNYSVFATGPHRIFVGSSSKAIFRSEVPIQ